MAHVVLVENDQEAENGQHRDRGRLDKLEFDSGWDEHPDYRGWNGFIQMYSSVILEFSLIFVQNPSQFLAQALQDIKFSKLSTLKVQDFGFHTTSEEYTNFIKELVSRAPNLETLHTEGFVDLNANLLEGLPEGSQAVHVTGYPCSPSLDEIPEDYASSLQVKRLRLIDINENFNLKRFNDITFKVLRASRETLLSMHISLPFLLPLMAYGITHMKNVRELNINLNICDLAYVDPKTWNTMKSFDFFRAFPNLDTVGIRAENHPLSFQRLERLVSTFLTMLPPPWKWRTVPPALHDRAAYVRNLDVYVDSEFTPRAAKHVAEMFPNIKKLSIRAKVNIPFHIIWSHWLHLKKLDVAIVDCGMHPEEVTEPSIANLKKLRTLNISLESTRIDPLIWFSRVLPLGAFRRCPNLEVNIRTDDEEIYEALSPLVPYVVSSLILDNQT